MIELFQTIAAMNFQELLNAGFLALGAFVAFLLALYNLFLLIPGDQPDKALKAAYDFTVRFSKK